MTEPRQLRDIARTHNIDEERYQWIVDHVNSATKSFFSNGGTVDVYSKDCKIDIFAVTLLNCCDTGAEGRFFCDAAKFILRENPKIDEESASNMASFMGHRCVQIADARTAMEQKPKPSGCLVVSGFFFVLPLGFYAARHFLA